MEAITTVQLSNHYTSDFLFHTNLVARGFKRVMTSDWEFSKADVKALYAELGEPSQVLTEWEKTWHFYVKDNWFGYVRTEGKSAFAKICAESEPVAESIIKSFREHLPEIKPAKRGKVQVKFWYLTNNGPQYSRRTITVPAWDKIKDNYESNTRGAVENLMDFKPTKGGQLLLWHGEPGTGKTYAIRALLSAWKDWCSAEYILDPELLFGSSAAYLNQFMAGTQNDDYDDDDGDDKWKLLILEDTGELLANDAKDRAGQGLSRLLNVADGLIGQGLKLLILITTNEELGKMHPAVIRPGRCAANIRFNSLSYTDALSWAKKFNVEGLKKQEYSLAQLYELTGEKQIISDEKEKVFGFKAL